MRTRPKGDALEFGRCVWSSVYNCVRSYVGERLCISRKMGTVSMSVL